MKILTITLLVLSFQTFSETKTCKKIYSIKDASKCIEQVGDELGHYEGTNTTIASKNKTALIDIITFSEDLSNERKIKIIKLILESDYLGAVFQHQDEMQIYYYAFKKGNNINPTLITHINSADIDYMFSEKAIKRFEKSKAWYFSENPKYLKGSPYVIDTLSY